jgi:mono/diheme cytochrome c family protein
VSPNRGKALAFPRFVLCAKMRAVIRRRARSAAFPAVLLLWVAACDPDPGAIREWTPQDHEPPDKASPDQVAEVEATPGEEGSADAQLVTQAWRKNCQLCHGPTGRGDGPQGPMLQAPDLTKKEWLSQATDAQIEQSIRQGKNKMPAFGHLPDAVVSGLVKRVRAGGLAH